MQEFFRFQNFSFSRFMESFTLRTGKFWPKLRCSKLKIWSTFPQIPTSTLPIKIWLKCSFWSVGSILIIFYFWKEILPNLILKYLYSVIHILRIRSLWKFLRVQRNALEFIAIVVRVLPPSWQIRLISHVGSFLITIQSVMPQRIF